MSQKFKLPPTLGKMIYRSLQKYLASKCIRVGHGV
jgi:hypothetical protein